MSDFVIGIPIGVAIGIAIGISIGIAIGKKQKPWSEMTYEEKRNRKILIGAIGKKQKPWSEMTYEEKRNRKILIGVLSITAILGLIVFLWQLFT